MLLNIMVIVLLFHLIGLHVNKLNALIEGGAF